MATHELFAYLTVSDGDAAIRFCEEAFGAKEQLRLEGEGGKVAHAEVDFGGWTLMLADEFPELGLRAPIPGRGACCTVHLHVDDADEVIRRAVEAGAELLMEPRDHSHGERAGAILDPSGHRWTIGQSIEDVSAEEMQRRYTAELRGRPAVGGEGRAAAPSRTTAPLSPEPIGYVRSPIRARSEAPRQGDEGAPDARLEIAARYAAALGGVEPGSEVFVLTWLHRAKRSVLEVHPRNDEGIPLTGVFATRSADRPNPIGLHRVTVRKRADLALHVGPLEAVDGTPVLDIKPVLAADR